MQIFLIGINGQPCMVLQTRYFDKHNGFVTEITKEDSKKKAFICAHEVAFDSKGKRSCNLSM